MSAQTTKQVLRDAIAKRLKQESNCSWCNPGVGDSTTSHGICQFHSQKMIAEIAEMKAKREQIAALPVSVAKEPVERLAKPQEFASEYSTKTIEHGRQIVVSAKETAWQYGAIDI